MESSSTVAAAGAYLGGLRELALSQPDQVAIVHGEQQLTFAMFTSGSSGRAKGIVHGPHSVTKALVTIGDVLGSGPGRGPIPSIGPFHWGGGFAAVYQLLNGRSIAILPIDGGDAGTMVEALRVAKIESAMLTPSLAVWLARNNSGGPLADLKSLALGGEPVTTAHLDELK